MSDFNANVGSEKDRKITGPGGTGWKRRQTCRLMYGVITNTWFDAHPGRCFIWTSPGNRVQSQIEYIMINSHKKAVKNSYQGADADSDHNPVVAKFKLSLKHVEKPKTIPKFAFSSLNAKEIREKLKEVMLKLPKTNKHKHKWLLAVINVDHPGSTHEHSP